MRVDYEKIMCTICKEHQDLCDEINKLKGAGALDSLIFKLLINSLTTRFLADPQKNPMDFTWGVLWTHITEHSMSKEEYRNMLAMHGVPLEVFDQDK